MPRNNSTKRDIALTFIRQFLAGLLQLGSMLIIARMLGSEGMGTYIIAVLLPLLLTQIFNLGVTSSNCYFIPSKQVSLDDAWAVTKYLTIIASIIGSILAIFFVQGLGAIILPNVDKHLLLLCLIIFPLQLFTAAIAGIFQALESFKYYNLITLIQPIVIFITLLSLFLFRSESIDHAIICTILSYLCAFLCACHLLVTKSKVKKIGTYNPKYLKMFLTYGFKAHISNILTFLSYRLDLVLINLFIGSSGVGIYSVAVRLIEQLWLISSATSTVIYPRLSSMVGSDKRESLTPIVARTVLWVTLFFAGLLAILANTLIIILFGDEFGEAQWALYILLPGVVLMSCARILANDLASRGMVNSNLLISFMALLVNVITNLILIPWLGVLGAALATTVSYSLVFIALLIIQKRLTSAFWWAPIVLKNSDIHKIKAMLPKWKNV